MIFDTFNKNLKLLTIFYLCLTILFICFLCIFILVFLFQSSFQALDGAFDNFMNAVDGLPQEMRRRFRTQFMSVLPHLPNSSFQHQPSYQHQQGAPTRSQQQRAQQQGSQGEQYEGGQRHFSDWRQRVLNSQSLNPPPESSSDAQQPSTSAPSNTHFSDWRQRVLDSQSLNPTPGSSTDSQQPSTSGPRQPNILRQHCCAQIVFSRRATPSRLPLRPCCLRFQQQMQQIEERQRRQTRMEEDEVVEDEFTFPSQRRDRSVLRDITNQVSLC